MHKLTIFTVLILVSLIALRAEISFTQHNLSTSFSKASAVDVYDVDKDGDKDIFASSYGLGEICWWENNSNQSFTVKHLIASGLKSVRHLRVADLDNDGNTDLAATQIDSNRVIIFYGVNQNPAAKVILDNQLVGAHTIDIIDFDHDNDLDLIISSSNMTDSGNGQIIWYRNDGNRTFSKLSLWQQYLNATYVEAVDCNGDNYFDLLTCDENSGKIAWLINSGDNLTFSERLIDSTFTAAHTVLAKDLDKDGDLDILGAACMSSQIAWWENSGNLNFTKHDLGALSGALNLDMGDFDLDGDNDLLAGGMATYFPTWLKNDGNQNFTSINLGSGNSFTGAFHLIPRDIDNDGDLDLIGAAWYGKVAWWENNAVTGIEENSKSKHSELLNNYPNPFNPSTTISYHLEIDNFAKISVYNSKCELVKVLVEGVQKSGNHRVLFDASAFDSGVYFYKLDIAGKSIVRKMLLVK